MHVHWSEETPMTNAEAEAIFARVAERAGPGAGAPRVADVAETLGLSADEVARMLAELRTHPHRIQRHVTSQRERRVWLLGGVASLALVGVALASLRGAHSGPWATASTATNTAASTPAKSTSLIPADRVLRVFVDEKDVGGTIDFDVENGDSQALSDALEAWMRANADRVRGDYWGSGWDANPETSRVAARAGRWEDVSGLRMAAIELRRSDRSGRAMRWASATAPIYQGDDALVAEAVAAERKRRVLKAVDQAKQGL